MASNNKRTRKRDVFDDEDDLATASSYHRGLARSRINRIPFVYLALTVAVSEIGNTDEQQNA
jgi:hypothetical protein